MRILDTINDRKLDEVTIYLTHAEARQMRDFLEALLEKPDDHAHISSDDYEKTITLCVYDVGRLEPFDQRSRELIQHDR